MPAVNAGPTRPTVLRAPAVRTPSRDVESALIDAAERVLVRDGPGAVTVRAVAAEAGVAPMGVYNHFGGKDGLVDGLLRRAFIDLRNAVAGQGETDPVERLRNSGARYREFALAHPARYQVMFDAVLHQENTAPDVQEHASAAFAELVGHVEFCIAAGIVAVDDEAAVLAQQIWSAVHGAVQLELKAMLQVPDAESVYRKLFQTLLRGLCRPGVVGP
jgi:AcrR family transcriptional regulator